VASQKDDATDPEKHHALYDPAFGQRSRAGISGINICVLRDITPDPVDMAAKGATRRYHISPLRLATSAARHGNNILRAALCHVYGKASADGAQAADEEVRGATA
jgi:hypothetical protein